MKFTFVILDDNPEIEETIAFALKGRYEYECITKEEIADCTGEYLFYPDNPYNPIGLRKACEWMEKYPGRDIYYPCVLNYDKDRVSKNRSFEHFNAGFRIEHSTPMGTIFRADFAKWLPWDKYGWYKYMLVISGTTNRTTKIDTKIYIGHMNMLPISSYPLTTLEEALTRIRMLRLVAREHGVSGRTATLIEWQLDMALRIAWSKVDETTSPEFVKQKIRDFIEEPV